MEQVVPYNLIFAENQQMETERLVLRPITLVDAQDMFSFASDAETTRYVYPTHQTLQDTRLAIVEYFMKEPIGKYGIVLKAEKRLIGTLDLRVAADKRIAEIGYTLARPYWRQGYTSEAALAMLQLGFAEMQLIRIFAIHDERNPGSGGVMRKIGMQQEGRIPNARWHKGDRITDIQYGITQEMWAAQNK